jgi:CBS domain containing-hemolysin-like protein
MMILSTLLIILLLIAVNALYVAAEFAAVSVRQSRIKQLAGEGHALAKRLLPWIEDSRRLDTYIAACQIGITFSSLVLGAYGHAALTVQLTPLFAQWGSLQDLAAQSTSAAVVLTALTITQVILGELIPKSLALQYPTQSALLTFIPMRWSLGFFSWFIAVLNGSGIFILKLFGVPSTGHRHIHSPEEIEMLIAESRVGGLLDPEEHRRLHRALRLGMKPVHHLMVPRRFMAAIDVSTPFDQVLMEVTHSPYSHLPVYRDTIDKVIGIVHTKDVILHYLDKGSTGSIEDVMQPVLYVPENLTAEALLSLMRKERRHQAVIIDEFGGTEGFVTLEDVLKEMLGEVADEFKVDSPQPELLPDGRARLPGIVRLEDVQDWIGIVRQGDAGTLGGHIVEVLGRVPRVGEKLNIEGVDLEIEQVEHQAIVSVLVPPPRLPEDNGRG